MSINIRSEKGQVIILLVLAISGLIGFAALAIDGAMVYSDRRIAQNAADAGSTAGAGSAGAALRYLKVSRDSWTCTDATKPEYASIQTAMNKGEITATDRAANNDFTDGDNGKVVTVTATCSDGATDERYIDIEVTISTPTRPSLIHLIYEGPMVNTVTSVGRVHAGYKAGLLEGKAIVGLCPDCKDTLKVVGTPKTIIDEGSIFVNSTDSRAFFQNGTASITLNNGAIDVVGGAVYDPDFVNADVNVNQLDMHIVYPDEIRKFEPPEPDECDPSNPAVIDGDTIHPGLWKSNKSFPPSGVKYLGDNSDGDIRIFCLDVSTPTAFQINSGDEIIGENVFFYIKNGGVDWATATIKLDAPDDEDSPYQGLLIYVDPHNYTGKLPNETVTINGKSDSTVIGTLFAPAAHCKLNGTGDVGSFHLQALCYTIDLEGNGLLDISYDPGENWQVLYPPQLRLNE